MPFSSANDRPDHGQRYRSFIRKSFANFDNRMSDIQQLPFCSPVWCSRHLHTELSLQGTIASEEVARGDLDEHLISVSTNPKAGIQSVFLYGSRRGASLSRRAWHVEEERRLFYVAVTRAKNGCTCVTQSSPVTGSTLLFFAQAPSSRSLAQMSMKNGPCP